MIVKYKSNNEILEAQIDFYGRGCKDCTIDKGCQCYVDGEIPTHCPLSHRNIVVEKMPICNAIENLMLDLQDEDHFNSDVRQSIRNELYGLETIAPTYFAQVYKRVYK